MDDDAFKAAVLERFDQLDKRVDEGFSRSDCRMDALFA